MHEMSSNLPQSGHSACLVVTERAHDTQTVQYAMHVVSSSLDVEKGVVVNIVSKALELAS